MAEGVSHAPAGPPQRLLRWAVVVAALLAIAGGVAFYLATQKRGGERVADSFRVVVTNKGCDPNAITVPAGKRSFTIVNQSDRPVEWEILDGVMVIEERENIAPGFSETMSVRLSPGDFTITCGLLSNPRGTLHVTPSEEAAAEAAKPTLRVMIGPLSEYRVYLVQQSSQLVTAVEALVAAIKSGDMKAAQALYEPARLPYKRIEAVAARFADLENAIDPVADYLEKREQDPAFTGFHRIEYGLFAEQSLSGLEAAGDKLLADVTALKDRVRALKLTPDILTDSASGLAEQLAQGRLATGENHYAHTDLADVEANLAGIEKTVELVNPVLEAASPALATELAAKLAAANDRLQSLKQANVFPAFDKVGEADRKALSQAFQDLTEALKKLPAAIGVGS